ncbi:MAG TPA: PEP-CTERM sorting domain-containing protein [Candidatus Saccharimonadales bacterium]|nr:PEP-CTERM sorting domain-containing protein [Candidatus Saccharimonadales bacterium]
MRGILIAAALVALAASPAFAAFTGSLYYSNFANHHVYRLDVTSNVPGATTDLAALPGADGLMFNPLNSSQILVGGQGTNNVYNIGTTGGSFGPVNTTSIVNGSYHLTQYFAPVGAPSPMVAGLAEPGIVGAQIVTSPGYSGVVPNTATVVDLITGVATAHTISGIGEVAGLQSKGTTLYAANSNDDGVGGSLFTLNLATNTATGVGVTGSHDIHGLWLDQKTGWLLATGMKHLEAIDISSGTPTLVYDWDLSALIPESPSDQGHTDQVSSDAFGNVFVAANSGEIIYVDLNAATPTPMMLKDVGLGLDDILTGPSTVPEPRTLLLAGLGLVGAGVLKRRWS